MSKEVKRYTANVFIPGNLGPVQREVVMEDDYDALLAERDALKAELAELVRIVSMSCDGSSARNKAMAKAHAALQGAQP